MESNFVKTESWLNGFVVLQKEKATEKSTEKRQSHSAEECHVASKQSKSKVSKKKWNIGVMQDNAMQLREQCFGLSIEKVCVCVCGGEGGFAWGGRERERGDVLFKHHIIFSRNLLKM